MRKATLTELSVLLAVFVVGLSAATLLAEYYPDSQSYVYVGGLTAALLVVLAFFMSRKQLGR